VGERERHDHGQQNAYDVSQNREEMVGPRFVGLRGSLLAGDEVLN
jgi:hypothetical protein